MVTFAQYPDTVCINASPRLECTNVVRPTRVYTDAVALQRLACEGRNETGHLFSLSQGGSRTCKIEAVLSNETLTSLVIVQECYSPLTVGANFVVA